MGKRGYSPAALAYGKIVMPASLIFRQGNDEHAVETDSDIADMIDLERSMQMTGDLLSSMPRSSGYRPQSSGLGIKMTDKSLDGRTEKYCAEPGLTPGQMRAAGLNALQHFGRTRGIVFDEHVTESCQQFPDGKTTPVVTRRPREPLDFAKIDRCRPSDVPALINIEAVAR